MDKNTRKYLYLFLSLGCSLTIFLYLFSHISVSEVIAIIRGADTRLLLVFVLLSLAMSYFRTWRYRVLLKVSGFRPSRVALFLVVLVRNFFSDLLPARLGTLVYVYIIQNRLGIPLAPALSSFALAFLFDILAIAPLFLLILLIMILTSGPGTFPVLPLMTGAILLAMICALLLYLLPKTLRWFASLCHKISMVPDKFATSLIATLTNTAGELEKTQKAGIYAETMFLSLAVRVTKYSALAIFLYALLLPLAISAKQLPPASIFLGLGIAELSASLPISGIGGFGVYEGTWAFIFELLGLSPHLAKLTGVSHHLFTQVYGYLLGGCALLFLLLPFFASKKDSGSPQEHSKTSFISFFIQYTLSICLVISLAIGAWYLPINTSAAKNTVAPPTEQERSNLAKFSQNESRHIVFDSNRSGSFGIYSITPKNQIINTISDTALHEMFPDPSPDGQWIAFARAESLSRKAKSEIWLTRIDGSDQRLLADNGTFPNFSQDGKRIFFERERKKVMQLTLASGQIEEIFPLANTNFSGHQVVKPRVSPDGRQVAFISDKKGRWNAWIVDLQTGADIHIGSGCEPAWFAGNNTLAWVKPKPAAAGSGIYSFSIATKATAILVDKGGPRGHEYFPTISPDNRFLLYSDAPANQHSHSTANYQIYIKPLPQGQPVRLTFDSHTNRWPKIIPQP